MASTYSNIKIQLMTTGENTTTWGDVTNVNLGTAIEEAIVGSADVAFSNANVTLTLTNTNSTQAARNMRLNLTGTATSGYNLVVPAIEKPYIINNGTDGTITVKNSTGSGVAVPAGKTMWVYNNGTDVVDVVTQVTTLATSGNVTIGGGGDLILSSATGGNSTTFYNDAQDLSINVNSAVRVFISSTGLTGIGVTAPKTRLQATAGGFLNAPVLGSATGAPVYVTNSDTAYGLLVGVNSVDGHAWLQAQRTDGTATAANITLNEAGGNLGVGTTTPGAKLDVAGNIRLSAASPNIEFNNGGAMVYGPAGNTLAFATGGGPASPVERFRIASAGQWGLGGANYGTSGQVLTSQGASAAPVWSTVATGTVTSVAGTGSVNGLTLTGTVTSSGSITLGGSITSVANNATVNGIAIGYRSIPRSTTSGTATVSDVGQCIAVTTGITIPNSTFAAGDAISIYNDSGSAITITAGVSTLRLAGTTTTGNRTLAARGMATIWFNSATEAVISGAGVS
jgi:hypothetical protein